MKKIIIKYSIILFSAFLLGILILNATLSKKIYKINLEKKEKILFENLKKINEINDEILINFLNENNLINFYYTEDGIIIHSAVLNQKSKLANLIKIKNDRENFLKNGYWIRGSKKLIYYFPYKEKGILVSEFNTEYEKKISQKIYLYSLAYIFVFILSIILISILYHYYNLYNPLYKLGGYLKNITEPVDLSNIELSVEIDETRDIYFFMKSFKEFLLKLKEKYQVVESDRNEMRKIYNDTNINNKRLMSLYGVLKLLSFEVDLEKIFDKVKDIMFNLANVNVLVLRLKKQNNEFYNAYLSNIDYYENFISDESAEQIAENYGKALKIKETSTDKRVQFLKMKEEDIEKLSQMFVVPLKTEEETIGFMILDSIYGNKLKHSEEISTLTIMGEIIGRTLERALKYRKINLGFNLISVLYRLNKKMSKNRDYFYILKEVTNELKNIIDYLSSSIYFFDSKNNLLLEPDYRNGPSDKILEAIEHKIAEGIKNKLDIKKEGFFINDFENESESLKELFKKTKAKILSLIVVPIIENEKIIGIFLITSDKKNKFKDDDLKIISVFSEQVIQFMSKLKYELTIRELIFKIKSEAISDVLTGFYNRRYFIEKINEEFKRYKLNGNNLGLIFIEIDNIELYENPIKEDFIREISYIIRTFIRNGDFCFRYTENIFAILMASINSDKINIISENIRDYVSKYRFNTKKGILSISLSIGISYIEGNVNTNLQKFEENAGLALFKAKSQGKNRVVFINNKM